MQRVLHSGDFQICVAAHIDVDVLVVEKAVIDGAVSDVTVMVGNVTQLGSKVLLTTVVVDAESVPLAAA